MAAVPYQLICAVQDLYELYSREGPRGPYRMQLFHDQAQVAAHWPAAVQASAADLDLLIRGASCLLANDLAAAALPVAAELWRRVQELERSLGLAASPIPQYYAYLTGELRYAPRTPELAYRLFGEVLAVYLDVLGLAQPTLAAVLRPRLKQLRRALLQAGVSSSSSAITAGD